METHALSHIAKMLGHDPDKTTGTQNWVPDTHPHLTISQIVVDGEAHPFRITDRKLGNTHTKLDEGFVKNVKAVDDHHAAVIEIQYAKNRDVFPALCAVLPSLDPSNADLVELKVGGQIKHATLGADGLLTNIREPTPRPEFSVANGVLVVNISAMNDADKETAKAALAKVAAKFVIRE